MRCRCWRCLGRCLARLGCRLGGRCNRRGNRHWVKVKYVTAVSIFHPHLTAVVEHDKVASRGGVVQIVGFVFEYLFVFVFIK